MTKLFSVLMHGHCSDATTSRRVTGKVSKYQRLDNHLILMPGCIASTLTTHSLTAALDQLRIVAISTMSDLSL